MTENQECKIAKDELKSTKLGKYILEKYTPKKDLIRKLAEYAKGVFSTKTLERVKSCGDFMQHLTTQDLSEKRVHKSNSCGNRFCPICTWNKAKKDAIMISVAMQAIREEKDQEYIFLTLTAPNIAGAELKNEIDRFNKAFHKLFKRRNVNKVINGYVRKLEVTYNKERFITKDMYKNAKVYFDKRGLQVGDNNPNYDTYHPHFHVIMAVNKSYFT
ncbi:protein rep, partial [Metabacillus fastidiosus]|uniref:protein rep n=1 Tax=Metabacillus fastidiosus TaxID=1458 RepID=UPI002E21A9EA